MNRYTFADGLPTFGAAGPLVTAAIAMADRPRTLTDLARLAGISKHAASRNAQQLVELGFLVHDERGYIIRRHHYSVPSLLEVAWRFSGVRLADEEVSTRRLGRPRLKDDYSYRHWVPDELASDTVGESVGGGPNLITVRDTVTELIRLTEELRSFEALGQEVYSLWSTERLRDIVHQTLHLGKATSVAAEELEAASGWHVQGSLDPNELEVPAPLWARATFLVSADCRRVISVLILLEEAVRVGGEVNRARSAALRALSQIMNNRDSEFTDDWLGQALDSLSRAESLWALPSEPSDATPYRNVGGMPDHVDVGTAGDQILAVQLSSMLVELTRAVDNMASHESVAEWRNGKTAPDLIRTPRGLQRTRFTSP